MHAPTSEHRNLECSARWQSYWDDVAVLLPEDPILVAEAGVRIWREC